MKISVVIPAYNAERYITGCVESVFKQTKKPDRILFVDDGSIDKTNKIIWDYGKLSYVASITIPENKGIGHARWRGSEYESRTGECDYIAFLSTDDQWQPNFLEVMSKAAEKNPHKIIYSGFTICNEQLIPQFDIIPPGYNLDQDNFRIWCYQLALRDNMNVNFSSVLIPIEIFQKINFNPKRRFGEDLEFLLFSMLHFDYFLVDQPLVKIRTHPGSMTNQKINEIHDNNLGIIKRFTLEMKKTKG